MAREVLGACLAGDLGLPVPEPFLIDVDREWALTIQDEARQSAILRSSPVAFGSRTLVGQFGIWGPGSWITDIMLPVAAGIFVFDAVIQNPDRRTENPNCLVRGDQVRIFDHELAFSHQLVIGWRPPWQPGSLRTLEHNGNHIFRDGLRRREIDFEGIRDAWGRLSDAQIADYEAAIPAEWHDAKESVAASIELIKGARDNIDAVLEEVRRVLA
ncbi:hypothetical protein KIP89_03700 [Ancylobacter sp. VKM B-3255]|uniref:HipA-like kinase domain-containing protein n=1 Tax=Ancylobacter radicis TaxID=2836179 RepID=A0ABS5R5Y6_9HYPH|nr:HipA family kinase [Ancylobacter radicis]MBS9476204.1 hypothetical protein [Ancylobacter radicis]